MFQKCLVCPAWGPWRSSARLRDGSHVSGVTCFLGILGGCVAMDATTDLYCIYLYLLYKHVSTDVFIVYIYIFLLTTDVKSQVYVTIIANGDCKVFMV